MSIEKDKKLCLFMSHARIKVARDLLRWCRNAESDKVVPSEVLAQIDAALTEIEDKLWLAAMGK